MKKVLGLAAPLAVTVVLFFSLYNNLNNGVLVLAVPLLVNLAIAIAPVHRSGRSLQGLSASAKPSAIYLMSLCGSILVIEVLFPVLLPREYAQIRELTKLSQGPVTGAFASLASSASDRESGPAPSSDVAFGQAVSSSSWHKPGMEFVYYGYDPNLKITYMNRVHWNSRGYFDTEYGLRKPEDVKRIVVIGDSYMEAIQVPLVRSFHKLLEASLNGLGVDTATPKFEVMALGNSGTGQVENFNVLKSQAVNYSPDAVIMTLCSNDFCDDDPDLSRELILASGLITPRIRRLAAHGYFALAFALRRIEDLERNRVRISPELLQWSAPDIPRVEAVWERTLGNVRESRDFCQERGIVFALVYLGSDLEVKYAMDPVGTISGLKSMGGPHKEIAWDMSRSINRVTEYCAEWRIPLISLLEPLIDAQKETGKYVFGDHYTMFGHQVAAQVLSCALSSRMPLYASERPSFKNCVSPGSWGAVASSWDESSPIRPPFVDFVPASGPTPQSR